MKEVPVLLLIMRAEEMGFIFRKIQGEKTSMLYVRFEKQNMTAKTFGTPAMSVNAVDFAGRDFNTGADSTDTVNGKPPGFGRFSYDFEDTP